MKKTSKIVSTIFAILLVPFGASATITATPSTGGSAYMDTNTVSVTWDATSYIEVEDPNGNRCYMNETGYGGFNTSTIGQGSTMSTYMAHATCDITFDDTTYWETDGSWTLNMWNDEIRTTLIDTGTFVQGGGGGGSTTTATTTVEIQLERLNDNLMVFQWLLSFFFGCFVWYTFFLS